MLKEVLDQDDLTFAVGLDGRDALLSLDTAVLPANDEAPTNEKSSPRSMTSSTRASGPHDSHTPRQKAITASRP